MPLQSQDLGSRELSQTGPSIGKEKNVLEVSKGSLWLGVSCWLECLGVAQGKKGPETLRKGNWEGPKGGKRRDEQGADTEVGGWGEEPGRQS